MLERGKLRKGMRMCDGCCAERRKREEKAEKRTEGREGVYIITIS